MVQPGAETLHRWVRCGHASHDVAATAVQQALEQIDPSAEVLTPALVVVFASPAYELSEISLALRAALGNVPLIGCSTAGEIAATSSSSRSVVIWCLGGDGFHVRVGCGEGDGGSLRQAARQAALCCSELPDSSHQALILLADGLCGDQMEVVRGAYEVIGPSIPLVGGCAGDDMAMQATQQLFGDRVLRHAVVAAAIGSDAPIGIGVSHGWEPVGSQMLVTASTGTSVLTLDDRPALDVYLNTLGAPEEATHSSAAFAQFAATHPLGIPRRDRIEIRYIAGADFEARSLTLIASMPQGCTAVLMRGDATSVLAASETACRSACDNLAGQDPIGMLLFDCVARRSVLESAGIGTEISRVRDVIGSIPAAGFYTYGEIARTHGAGGFHNQTLVALALA